ncbi:MAG: polyprenyl synthetase family protein [Treponema sp.]|nr:polyprenyl synthetase family protein [Treponema sp.]
MDFSGYLARIEQEIDRILPKNPDESWASSAFGSVEEPFSIEQTETLTGPTRSLVELGGKRWRPLLLTFCAMASSKDNPLQQNIIENAYHLCPLVECIHTASLIHDDIEDSSESRRGQPAAYITYGLDTALNAGSWLYFLSSTCINSLDSDDATKLRLYSLFTEEVRRLHLGQALDIKWHRTPELCPSTDEYLSMVKYKTGTLSSLAAKTGTLIAGAGDDKVTRAGKTAAKIGAGFQIIDDCINLTTGNPGKKRGDDIVEGKKSLPVLLFLEKHPEQKETLFESFEQASVYGIESPSVEKAIFLMHNAGSISQAADRGVSFIKEGCLEFESLYGKSEETDMIKNLFYSMIPPDFAKEGAI